MCRIQMIGKCANELAGPLQLHREVMVVAAVRPVHRHELEQIVIRVESPLVFDFFLVWARASESACVLVCNALRIEAPAYVVEPVLIPYEILRGWLSLLAFSFRAEALSFLLLVSFAVVPAVLGSFSFLRRRSFTLSGGRPRVRGVAPRFLLVFSALSLTLFLLLFFFLLLDILVKFRFKRMSLPRTLSAFFRSLDYRSHVHLVESAPCTPRACFRVSRPHASDRSCPPTHFSSLTL